MSGSRLLQEVDGSVLWLLRDNDDACRNLRAEAEARDVSAERLVFADRLPLTEHIGRHQLADVFLDTLPYNAHTTASDALWSGLPLITCTGQTFASRVAASLLHAAGVPELVSHNLVDYQAMAMKLARDPELLAQLKGRLDRNRLSCPLFDTTRFTRHVEAAYNTMAEQLHQGAPPRSFSVEPI